MSSEAYIEHHKHWDIFTSLIIIRKKHVLSLCFN